jgi:hypothetical protein
MKKFTTYALAVFTAAITLSSAVEAKTVLSKKERCFSIGDPPGDPPSAGGWIQLLKIKPQQALTDKQGTVVETVALVRGAKPVYPPPTYYNQFAGAASYIAADSQVVKENVVQIALVGTSYGTDTGFGTGIYGLWSFSYTLMLEPEKKGKVPGGKLMGVDTFKPIGNGHDADPASQTLVNEPVNEISCSAF